MWNIGGGIDLHVEYLGGGAIAISPHMMTCLLSFFFGVQYLYLRLCHPCRIELELQLRLPLAGLECVVRRYGE